MPLTGHSPGKLAEISTDLFRFIMFDAHGGEVQCVVTRGALERLAGRADRAADDIFEEYRKSLYAAANRACESAGGVRSGEMLNVDKFL